MKRIQNLLAVLTVGLIGGSVASLAIGGLGALIGAETVTALFGYLGFCSGLAMLATGGTMTVVSALRTWQSAHWGRHILHTHHAHVSRGHGRRALLDRPGYQR